MRNATHLIGEHQATRCGQWAHHDFSYTTDETLFRSGVYSETGQAFPRCRRCLASLAKRDREFQRKARKGIGYVFRQHGGGYVRMSQAAARGVRYLSALLLDRSANEAARAIAREEGRS